VLPKAKELNKMKIYLTSVFVDDQDKALKFYTEVLGFIKKADFPVGQFKWLTVVSPEEPDGVELLLEPNENPATKPFQKALFEQGIAATSFAVSDIQKEYERMKKLGVVWTQEPTPMGPATIAVFDDTCGNLIQIAQKS
jgi:catechol 2,3-dioxygenase-like lactoylglutathione lyase family enzyme